MLQTKLKLGFIAGQPGHGRAGALRHRRAAGPAQPGDARASIYGPDNWLRTPRTTSTIRATDGPDDRPAAVRDAWGILWRRTGRRGAATAGTIADAHVTTGPTDDDTRPGRGATPSGRPARDAPRAGAADAAPEPAGAPARRARAQGRRPVPRRARHEDPGALPRRPGARRLPRAARRVYTKGFLRNYALYLGLDPDEVLAPVAARARRAQRGRRRPSRVPRPLAAPRQGLTFSPVIVVAARS